MAGSKQIFIYNGNSGERLVRLDESNTRALGYQPATSASGLTEITKLTGRERYILVQGKTSGDKVVQRKLIVPEEDNDYFQNGGTLELPVLIDSNNLQVENVTFRVTLAVGESKRFASFEDTGLDDGTNP